MLKLATNNEYLEIYNLLKTKKKVFSQNYNPPNYDDFLKKMEKSKTTRIFLNYQEENLDAFLITRTVTHTFAAWYAHLIVVRSNIPLRTSHRLHAELYDYAISYYETEMNLFNFIYIQPTYYKKVLVNPVRKYASKLLEYKTILLQKISPNEKIESEFIRSLINNIDIDNEISIILKSNKVLDEDVA